MCASAALAFTLMKMWGLRDEPVAWQSPTCTAVGVVVRVAVGVAEGS